MWREHSTQKLCKNIDFAEVVRIGNQQSDCRLLPPDGHRMMEEGTPGTMSMAMFIGEIWGNHDQLWILVIFWRQPHACVKVLHGFARLCKVRCFDKQLL